MASNSPPRSPAESISEPSTRLIVGTAGHIDHGKTSLIKLLTGVDLDTLPEEKERRITIALGFTHLALSSGREIAFVDVPGHERLVRTMVAGASGIDAVMLVVSAVEGVKPQTLEHLQILELLGVDQGMVVLTFRDMVDDELLELAAEEIKELLAPTSLASAPILAVSNLSGEGKDEVIAALDALGLRKKNREGPFRLPVDRVFTRHGHGTVVTGTVLSGQLRDGETIELVPGGEEARVRGIQVHGRKVAETVAGQRAALNISLPRVDVDRGQQIVSLKRVPETRIIDVSYQHLTGAPTLNDQEEVRFLVGTADVHARIRPIGVEMIPPQGQEERGWRGYAQIQLAEAVACLPGDRFVLRRPSPTRTLGGGVILDPWAGPFRRRDQASAQQQLEALEAGDRSIYLLRGGRKGLTPEAARQRGCSGEQLGDRLFHQSFIGVFEDAVKSSLAAWHAANPLSAGAGRAEIRQGQLRWLGERALDALLSKMAEQGHLARIGNQFRLSSFEVRLSADQLTACRRILQAAGEAGSAALETQVLVALAQTHRAEDILHYLVGKGELVAIGPFSMGRKAADSIMSQARDWLRREGSFTTSQAKEWTGLTRKHLIPILEWLDANQITRRAGESRVSFR